MTAKKKSIKKTRKNFKKIQGGRKDPLCDHNIYTDIAIASLPLKA